MDSINGAAKQQQTPRTSEMTEKGAPYLPIAAPCNTILPTEADVLSCSNPRIHPHFQQHPGSARFANLIKEAREEYQNLTSRTQKTIMIEGIVRSIHEAGGRFLFYDDDSKVWSVMLHRKSTDKIGHALRFRLDLKKKKKKIQGKLKTQSVTKKNEMCGHDKGALARLVLNLRKAKKVRAQPRKPPIPRQLVGRTQASHAPYTSSPGSVLRRNQVADSRLRDAPIPESVASRHVAAPLPQEPRPSQPSEREKASVARATHSVLPRSAALSQPSRAIYAADKQVDQRRCKRPRLLPEQVSSGTPDPRSLRPLPGASHQPRKDASGRPAGPETFQRAKDLYEKLVVGRKSVPEDEMSVNQGTASLPKLHPMSKNSSEALSYETIPPPPRQQQQIDEEETKCEEKRRGAARLPSQPDEEPPSAESADPKEQLPSCLTPIGTIYSDQHGGLIVHLPERGILKYVTHFDS